MIKTESTEFLLNILEMRIKVDFFVYILQLTRSTGYDIWMFLEQGIDWKEFVYWWKSAYVNNLTAKMAESITTCLFYYLLYSNAISIYKWLTVDWTADLSLLIVVGFTNNSSMKQFIVFCNGISKYCRIAWQQYVEEH